MKKINLSPKAQGRLWIAISVISCALALYTTSLFI